MAFIGRLSKQRELVSPQMVWRERGGGQSIADRAQVRFEWFGARPAKTASRTSARVIAPSKITAASPPRRARERRGSRNG
jgi:hypothetical protein